MTRFALYCRVATQDKQDLESSQLARCHEYMAARGWTAVAEYVNPDEAGNASTNPWSRQ